MDSIEPADPTTMIPHSCFCAAVEDRDECQQRNESEKKQDRARKSVVLPRPSGAKTAERSSDTCSCLSTRAFQPPLSREPACLPYLHSRC